MLFAALAIVLILAAAPAVAAERPVRVEVGKVMWAAPVEGHGVLLVPVRYPIQMLGHRLGLTVSLGLSEGGALHSWDVRARASAGPPRRPERRRAFTFVHRIDLSRQLTRRVRADGARPSVRVEASARLDANADGVAELSSSDRESQALSRAYAPSPLCASIPQLRTEPGKTVATRLPVCGSAAQWRIDRSPRHGVAWIRDGKLMYRSGAAFRGTESIGLASGAGGATASAASAAISAPVEIEVVGGEGPLVRAIGDSVTAGFGYYEEGSPMRLTSLLSCKPGNPENDACSSNSSNRSNKGSTVNYSPDYGLSNNVSWTAQWANEYGVTNYENLAISGSVPGDWAPGGKFYSTTQQVEAEDPDYILMTVGANPLLSEMLFGIDHMGCAIWSDIFGKYAKCIEEAFESVHLRANLANVYRDLVNRTGATVYLMQYHLSVPSIALAYTATQIAMMGQMLNREIASVAAEVSRTRLQVIAPPHFNVGIDISPVYPSTYSCSRFGYKVDGRSVQSGPTQTELHIFHPLSFCSGPEEGPPWVISGDTGIHPSAAGYAQMASRVPAPR